MQTGMDDTPSEPETPRNSATAPFSANLPPETGDFVADELVEVFYVELRRLAAAQMKNEPTHHTWQPTALLNELYLELRKVQHLRRVDETDEEARAAFIGFAANLMKRLLIHHARPIAQRAKRVGMDESSSIASSFESLKEMELMLERLGDLNPQLLQIVQLKVFEGLSEMEIAKRLGTSLRSVARRWHFARHWLSTELGSAAE